MLRERLILLKQTELSDCIQSVSKSSGMTIQQFINEKVSTKLKKLANSGLSGQTVYPTLNEKVLVKKNDTYVPGLADKFMLAYDFIDKKTKKPIKITSRTGDYTLLEKLNVPQPPIGWYMSEKYDGQRALWDGAKFVTRGSISNSPRVYPYVPNWFIALMPPGIALDGEFFIKRNAFQELGFLKSKLKPDLSNQLELDKKWVNIKYYVFDSPSFDEPFEKRMEMLKKVIESRCKMFPKLNFPPYININEYLKECPLIYTEQYLIKSEADLTKYYTELISQDAEGVMIRAPKIKYVTSRTRFILKLKPEEEAECRIIGYKQGTGKYLGSLGSFECEMISNDSFRGKDTNKTFYVSGMSDSIRDNYLKRGSDDYHPIGTVITYKYTFLTDDGIPRFPRYKGKRMEYEQSEF